MRGGRPFQIGEFSFDPARQTVVGPGGEVHLEPKPMAVAACLAERAGSVVSRDDLIREVWDNYPGADQSLSQTISRLRRLLGDSARSPHLIETVPKRGYRLSKERVKVTRVHGVAVLPFRQIGRDPENAYLCEGLAEELLNVLAGLSGLRVAARSASFALAQRDVSLAEIGRHLNVAYALEGAVQRAGNKVRIWVRLMETCSETQIWSRDFLLDWIDLLEIQDTIARTVTEAFREVLDLPAEPDDLGPPPAIDPDAYAIYLKARYLWYRDNLNPGKALEYFRRAIDMAPDFAAPYAGIVDCYCTYAIWQLMDQHQARVQGLACAARGLSLAPDSPDVLFSHGYAQFYLAWDWDESDRSFRETLGREPEHLLANSFLCVLCAIQGRDDEALQLAAKLLKIDPVSGWSHFIASGINAFCREFDAAAEIALEGLELAHQPAPCLWTASFTLADLGRTEEAFALARKLEQISGDADFLLGLATAAYAMSGAREDAESALSELRRRQGNKKVSPIAMIYALTALGYDDEAIQNLQAAYDEHNVALFLVTRECLFDPLRHRPEFQEIMRKSGLDRGAAAAAAAVEQGKIAAFRR